MSRRVSTYEDRPEPWGRAGHLREAWPAFISSHRSPTNVGPPLRAFRRLQFWLVDEDTDDVLAEGNPLPVRLDVGDLPDRGWEHVIEHATAARRRAHPRLRPPGPHRPKAAGGGLSSVMLGEVLSRSMEIPGMVADWESWTVMRFSREWHLRRSEGAAARRDRRRGRSGDVRRAQTSGCTTRSPDGRDRDPASSGYGRRTLSCERRDSVRKLGHRRQGVVDATGRQEDALSHVTFSPRS